jgi:putative PEP-CTERM system histidine kinase
MAALLSLAAGTVVLYRDRRSPIHRIYAAGMAALAAREVLTAVASGAASTQALLWWSGSALVVEAFVPGIWLLFSLSFGRTDYRALIGRWWWAIGLTFLIPIALAVIGQPATSPTRFFSVPLDSDPSTWAFIPLGRPGYLFRLASLLGSLVILTNLERMLREAVGTKRWQIKFVVLGIGGVFAVRIYTDSQALLFGFVEAAPDPIVAGSLWLASLLTLLSLGRMRLFDIDLYLHASPVLLYNSLTVSFVGFYLLVVGVAAQILSRQEGDHLLPVIPFLVFLAMMGLLAVLLSSRVRQYARRQVVRHLGRPAYDYRREWRRFTECTTSLLDIQGLCGAVTRMVSETFSAPSVTIWLYDGAQDYFTLGGSTALSQAGSWRLTPATKADRIRSILEQPIPVEMSRQGQAHTDWPERFCAAGLGPSFWDNSRYAVPLVAGRDELLGLMLLGERSTGEPLSIEDLDLLKTLADQAAGTVHNLRLSAQLVRAKELEAFQTVSAFFVHDLKNLISTLSLLTQTLPNHYDDPVFRADALRAMSQGVERITQMLGSLSQISQSPALQTTETDLNDLVRSTLAEMNGLLQTPVTCDLQPAPTLSLDSKQFQKVLINLLLNAHEAVGGGSSGECEVLSVKGPVAGGRKARGGRGEIKIETGMRNGWAVLSVGDTGCGMSQAFMEQALFQPFRTTKRRGLGIGLFQSKRIIEAHQGWFEVESEEGKGTTFRVILPMGSREKKC